MTDTSCTALAEALARVTAKGKAPYAGKERKPKKIPVPQRKQAESCSDVASGMIQGQTFEAASSAADQRAIAEADQRAWIEPVTTADLPKPEPVTDEVELAAYAEIEQDYKQDDGLDLPEYLKVENRPELSPERKAELAAQCQAEDPSVKQAALREAQKAAKNEAKRERAEAREAKRKAVEAAKITTTDKRINEGQENDMATKKAKAKAKKAAKAAPAKAKKAKRAVTLAELADTPQGKANRKTWDKVTGDKPQSKTAIIGALLKREKGCTTADVLEATGWPSVSMPAQAKATGLTLRKEKIKGEPTRYYGS